MPDAPLLLGIEIGGTKLQLGLGRGDGRLLALKRMVAEPCAGAAGIRRQIAEALPSWLDEHGFGASRLSAAGVGFGGPVDAETGTVVKSFQVQDWDGFPLGRWVRGLLGTECVAVQNDSDTAALGEARFGAGVGLSPILYVNSGSGIGGGLIVDGRIYRGSGVGAIEIGHVWVEAPGGPIELEQVASGWAIGRAAASWSSAEAVANAAMLGELEAQDVLARATTALGHALAQAVTLLAPRRVVLGGGVSLMPEGLWLEPIRQALDSRVFPPFRGTFDVVTAALGEDVVVQGALALAHDLVQ